MKVLGENGAADALLDGTTWKALTSFHQNLANGCAAFAADNNSTVYMIGGRDEQTDGSWIPHKEIWTYNFPSDSYDFVGTLPIDHGGIMNHACQGFLYGPDKRPVSFCCL